MRLALALSCTAACLWGCSDSPDGGTQQFVDGGVNADANVVTTGPEFQIEVVDGVNTDQPAGESVVLALAPGGQPHAVYGVAPISGKYELWSATRGGDGTWAKELITRPGSLEPTSSGQIIGLGFTYVGAVPHVVYLGGTGDMRPLTPYPTDLYLSTKQGATWSEQPLVITSGEATCDCPGTQNTCNFGNVVGSHPSIAAHPSGSGYAVVYRDTHGGFARDDLAKSDVEIYTAGTAQQLRECVDAVRSGGAFGDIAFTPAGHVVLAYNLDDETGSPVPRTGVWAAAHDGSSWTLTRVSESLAGSRVALKATAGAVYLAFGSSGASPDLIVATSVDEGKNWTTETVDNDGKTGMHPSMAIDQQGRPVIAYGYCGKSSDRDCPGKLGADSLIKIARKESDGWHSYPVDDGRGFGKVGLDTSIVVTADGKLGIAFGDDNNHDLVYAREK